MSQAYPRARLATSVSVAALATQTYDVDVSSWDRLWVFARLLGTTTVADLTILVPRPYLPDDSAVLDTPNIIPVVAGGSLTPVVSGADLVGGGSFIVSGLTKVRVGFTNNHATLAKNLDAWYLMGYSC